MKLKSTIKYSQIRPYYLFLFLIVLFITISACNNSSIEHIVKKADNLVEKGNTEEAIITYHKGIQDNPKEAVLYLNQAALFRKDQKYPKAIRNYEVVLKLNPKSFWPYIGLGRVYLMQKHHDKARKILKQGLDKLPKNGSILFYLGRVYYEVGDGHLALDYFNRALDNQYAKMHNVYYYRGLTFERLLDNKERAKLDFESYVLSEDAPNKDEIRIKIDSLKLDRYDF